MEAIQTLRVAFKAGTQFRSGSSSSSSSAFLPRCFLGGLCQPGRLAPSAGNTFYLSLPADSKRPQAGADSAGEAVGALSRAPSLPLAVPLPGCQESTRETPASWLSQGTREAGAIFQTIEQLALKLTKLKDVEGAYQQLLLQQPPLKGHLTTEATPGQESTLLPEPSQMSPSTDRGSRASHPSSPEAARPDVNGLSLALPEDVSQEVTL